MINSLEKMAGYPSAQDILSYSASTGTRVVIGGLIVFGVGYYSLGVAYYSGLMAKIDVVAMEFLLPSVGYAGIGAMMPTVQWYAAWSVRIVSGCLAGIVFDIFYRITEWSFKQCFQYSSKVSEQQMPYK